MTQLSPVSIVYLTTENDKIASYRPHRPRVLTPTFVMSPDYLRVCGRKRTLMNWEFHRKISPRNTWKQCTDGLIKLPALHMSRAIRESCSVLQNSISWFTNVPLLAILNCLFNTIPGKMRLPVRSRSPPLRQGTLIENRAVLEHL
jgi:hypothetical protein